MCCIGGRVRDLVEFEKLIEPRLVHAFDSLQQLPLVRVRLRKILRVHEYGSTFRNESCEERCIIIRPRRTRVYGACSTVSTCAKSTNCHGPSSRSRNRPTARTHSFIRCATRARGRPSSASALSSSCWHSPGCWFTTTGTTAHTTGAPALLRSPRQPTHNKPIRRVRVASQTPSQTSRPRRPVSRACCARSSASSAHGSSTVMVVPSPRRLSIRILPLCFWMTW